MFFLKLFAIFGLVFGGGVAIKYEGDLCLYAPLRVNGLCKKAKDCQYAVHMFSSEKVTPQLCSYGVQDAIVCCPNVGVPTTTTAIPTTTPASIVTTTTTNEPMKIESKMGVIRLEIGDACYYEHYQKQGVCKLFNNCPTASQLYRTQQVYPQRCGYVQGKKLVVCCPDVGGGGTGQQQQQQQRAQQQQQRPQRTTHATPVPQVIANRGKNFGAKARAKCVEYGKYVYTVDYPFGTNDDDDEEPAITRRTNECAQVKTDLILGGEMAGLKEFPHMALLGLYENNGNGKNVIKYVCGGSIISERFILTAAHCVKTQQGPIVHVRLGDLNISSTGDDGLLQIIDVAETIKHPLHVHKERYNDIALLKLATDIEFNGYVRPICLNVDERRPEHSAIATGWGTTEEFKPSDVLLKVTLNYVPDSRCLEIFTTTNTSLRNSLSKQNSLSRGFDSASMLCAGFEDKKKDACQGDSGGPLQVFNKDVYCMYDQIGITSFGKGCGNLPGVYTRVIHYVDWIESVVWP